MKPKYDTQGNLLLVPGTKIEDRIAVLDKKPKEIKRTRTIEQDNLC